MNDTTAHKPERSAQAKNHINRNPAPAIERPNQAQWPEWPDPNMSGLPTVDDRHVFGARPLGPFPVKSLDAIKFIAVRHYLPLGLRRRGCPAGRGLPCAGLSWVPCRHVDQGWGLKGDFGRDGCLSQVLLISFESDWIYRIMGVHVVCLLYVYMLATLCLSQRILIASSPMLV